MIFQLPHLHNPNHSASSKDKKNGKGFEFGSLVPYGSRKNYKKCRTVHLHNSAKKGINGSPFFPIFYFLWAP